ncbi:MAG: sigma-70 family RNA polymerase sigma factor [Bacteroidota bacterium]
MKAIVSDQIILEGILTGGAKQEKAIKRLYEQYFHLIYNGRKKYHQLSDDDLLTAYNAAIISLRRHVLNQTFRGDSSLWTYLNKIFYNKCIDIIRKVSSNREDAYENLPDQEDEQGTVLSQMTINEEFDQLVSQLAQLGEPCKQIIMDSEYLGYNSEEIAQRVGFSNARSVNSKKYSCLQRLRKLLESVKTGKQS